MRKPVSREHLLGSTVWAYTAGAVTVNAWTDGREHASKLRRGA